MYILYVMIITKRNRKLDIALDHNLNQAEILI